MIKLTQSAFELIRNDAIATAENILRSSLESAAKPEEKTVAHLQVQIIACRLLATIISSHMFATKDTYEHSAETLLAGIHRETLMILSQMDNQEIADKEKHIAEISKAVTQELS